MQYRKPEGPVADEIRAVVELHGYGLVAFSSEVVHKRMHVHCVLHHPDGVDLDALAEIHRALQPRIEILLSDDETPRDVRVEFSSPGLTRRFTSFHEFEVFLGKDVTVLPEGRNDWVHGTVIAADREHCLLQLEDGAEMRFVPGSIVKAQLKE